jgi:RHS repeat-associated protein
LDSYAYLYDPANRRTNLTRADASTVAFAYDNIGQLKVADSSIDSEDRGYTYDAAWNLIWRTNNGTASQFKVNSLNELTNAPSPVGNQNYDGNGNILTNHPGARGVKWTFFYDDENRLIELIRTNSTSDITATDFIYDGLGRLRERLEYSPTSGVGWTVNSDTHYIYDGMRVIQERDVNNTPTVSYTRGNDLSGTLEGAGGIGGLLARSLGYSSGNWTNQNYYFADGNGNITYVLNSSQGMVYFYRYDPFGTVIGGAAPLNDPNPNVYRFSSKECHLVSGMYYYGYRFYDPNLQRWMNRDPIAELGFTLVSALRRTNRGVVGDGTNLYRFVANQPSDFIDPFGLAPWKSCQQLYNECLARGLVVCTIVGVLNPGLYWPCIIAYGLVCTSDYNSCLKGNNPTTTSSPQTVAE